MYRRLNDIEDVGVFSETRPNGDTDWYLNTFIPELPFSDEERLLGNAPNQPSKTWFRMIMDDMLGNRPLLSRQRAEMTADGNGPLNLGYLLTESGQTDLAARLEQKSGPYRIVFIGSFQDPENDVHNTVFGAMHGSVILLNIFYELQQGHHHVSLLYLVMLLAGFWYITRVLVRRAVRVQPEPEPTASGNWLGRVFDFLRFLYRFVFEEERHVWLLLILVILADLIFGHIINIMGLAIYLVVFDALLRFFSQRRVA